MLNGKQMEKIAMENIHVVAVITAKTGMREKILEAFHQNSTTVRQEQGCIEYIATVDANDAGAIQTKFGDNTFVVVEKWENLGALKDHAVSLHMAAYAQKTKDLIESRTIYVLSPTAGL
jgi:quinol monooxygenase YgiN